MAGIRCVFFAVHTVSTDLNSVFIQKIALSHLMCDLDSVFLNAMSNLKQ